MASVSMLTPKLMNIVQSNLLFGDSWEGVGGLSHMDCDLKVYMCISPLTCISARIKKNMGIAGWGQTSVRGTARDGKCTHTVLILHLTCCSTVSLLLEATEHLSALHDFLI